MLRETATTGECRESMTTNTWDVPTYKSKHAQVRLVDRTSDGLAHIHFDDLRGNILCK